MDIISIAKNDDWEIKCTTTFNFVLLWHGAILKHLCPSELESLRAILCVPLLENEV